MNVSREAQNIVERIYKLLSQFNVPCSYHMSIHDPGYEICPCRGTNLEPDPAYDGLRELVEDYCPHSRESVGILNGHQYCYRCHHRTTEKGILTRDWTTALSGCLYGAAIKHLPKGWLYIQYGDTGCSWIKTAEDKQFYLYGDDLDLATMNALVSALMETLKIKV